MATLSITKAWADGEVLLEADLDNIKDDVETFLNTTKINDDNIQNAGITASSKLIDASISTAKLANLAITTAKIDDLAVTTGKLAASAVTTAKITDANVTKAKLAAGAKDLNVTSKTADYTVTASDEIIKCDSSSVALTMTLPAASDVSGHELVFIKTSSSNTVTIDPNSTETINGSATFVMRVSNEMLRIASDGSGWYIVAHYIPSATFAPVIVRASRASSLPVSDSSYTIVPFTTEAIDNMSAYNSTTGEFIAPYAGDYQISASLKLEVTSGDFNANEYFAASYKVNSGSQIILGQDISTNTHSSSRSVSGSDVVTLAAGDSVYIYAYQNSSFNGWQLVADATINHMSIVRVR
jgi:hypothetical protein